MGGAVGAVVRRGVEVDRAISEAETSGFLKLVAGRGARVLDATAVVPHGDELIGELALAIQMRLSRHEIAGTIHRYPTWFTAVQRLAADGAIERFTSGRRGRVAMSLSGLGR